MILYKYDLDLDLPSAVKDCERIRKKILSLQPILDDNTTAKDYDKALYSQLTNAPITSRLHSQYNAFTFPYQTIYEMCVASMECFKMVVQHDEPYCVHAWLNYQSRGEVIPRHYHWKGLSNLDKTYVGVIHINSEPSTITYYYPDSQTEVMECINNTFVLYEDDGNSHEVSVWEQDKPRISIAMDFVPMKYIPATKYVLNTWMPVL